MAQQLEVFYLSQLVHVINLQLFLLLLFLPIIQMLIIMVLQLFVGIQVAMQLLVLQLVAQMDGQEIKALHQEVLSILGH